MIFSAALNADKLVDIHSRTGGKVVKRGGPLLDFGTRFKDGRKPTGDGGELLK